MFPPSLLQTVITYQVRPKEEEEEEEAKEFLNILAAKHDK